MIKIGIVGAGHLGKIHIKLLRALEQVGKLQLIGFYDIDAQVMKTVEEQFNLKAFSSFDDLLSAVDAIDIVCPTTNHYEYAEKCIYANKPIFLEKPACATSQEVEDLLALNTNGLKIQVGHVERFNPAYLSVASKTIDAQYYTASRLSPYNVRGTDVSVVMDLMIHDIDVLLKISNHTIENVKATGFSSLSETIDHADASIYFSDGSIANLTASRIADRRERLLNVYEYSSSSYTLDFLNKKTSFFQLKDKYINTKVELDVSKPEILQGYFTKTELPVPNVNAIEMELEMFIESINEELPVTVSLKEALRVIKTAEWIEREIKTQSSVAVLD